MTEPIDQITCFVQTNMVGMSYGDIVTLAHTPYVDALIEGGRLIAETDPIYAALLVQAKAQPVTWSLLDTAAAAASPAVSVTPATAILNGPIPTFYPTDAAAPADPALSATAAAEAAAADAALAPVDAPVDAPADPAV